jgi:membrane protein required for colicin V production
LSGSIVDIIVLAVIAVSALISFMLGFVRELLWIGAWAIAIVAGYFGWQSPALTAIGRGYIPNEQIADVATGVAVFLVTLVVAFIITHFLSRGIRNSVLGPLDRSLGLLFGVLRGAVIVCVMLMIVDVFFDREKRPEWITQARTYWLVEMGTNVLYGLLPESVVKQGQDTADAATERARQAVDVVQTLRVITGAGDTAAPAESGSDSAVAPEDSGYNDAERKAMDRVMQQSAP